MIAADIAHVLHVPIPSLRRERWSKVMIWHRQARRIAAFLGVPLLQTGKPLDDGSDL